MNQGAPTAGAAARSLKQRAGAGQTNLRRVGLIYDARRVFDRKVMAGVVAFLKERGEFCLQIAEGPDPPGPGFCNLDGIIANLDYTNVRRAVHSLQLPAVGFGSGQPYESAGFEAGNSTPCLFPSHTGIAGLAADHFVAGGLTNFGYCGADQTDSRVRSHGCERAFVATLSKRGFKCGVWPGRIAGMSLADWLLSLPKPAGVLASDDSQARRVLEACCACGIDVPGDVAVIGVDNDEFLCGLGMTALTSIEPGAARLGYEAAEILDAIIRGKRPAALGVPVEPVSIVRRQSTGAAVVRDPVVARAVAIIQEGLAVGIRVGEVPRAVAMSRPSLERRFRKEFGDTIHGVMRGIQLEKAKRLVAETDLPLKQIAVSAGLHSVQYMTTLFRRKFGLPPAVYRHRIRL